MKKVEVLAPAGSFESMKAAVSAGADAVYIGGSRFGARAYADNLDRDRMLEAIDCAHLHGVSLYMTVNTLVKEPEFNELYDYLLPYYERGLDAVIVQDYGVLSAVRRWFPDMHVHASTQMTVTGVYGARILKEMGAARVVTARELSLQELKAIHEQVDIEIESFVHGALCYCYSGQCLMSSLIGGRSGNRGRCAQPCRLPYDVMEHGQRLNPKDRQYVMSLKDLCTLDILPDILESGVFSLKIEGRMKPPRYTAGVVSIYRKYVDLYLRQGRAGYHVDDRDRRSLLELFDRGGQTEGYYRQHNGRDMVVMKEKPAFRQADQSLFDYLDRTYVETEKKESICGKLTVREGEPVHLKLQKGAVSAAVSGAPAQTARNQPMTCQQLEKQMRKTGDTPFEFVSFETETEGRVFVPVQALNELRREGLRQLEKAILHPFWRNAADRHWEAAGPCGEESHPEKEKGKEAVDSVGTVVPPAAGGAFNTETLPEIHVLVSGRQQFCQALREPDVSEIQMEADGFSPEDWAMSVRECHQAGPGGELPGGRARSAVSGRNAGKRCVLAMPIIFRTEARAFFGRNREMLKNAGFDGILVRNLEEIGFLRELYGEDADGRVCPPVFSDHHLYMFNHEAAAFLTDKGVSRQTYPLELNERELRELAEQLRAQAAGRDTTRLRTAVGTSAGLQAAGGDSAGLQAAGEDSRAMPELMAYGYLPAMVTAQCIRKTADRCRKGTGGVLMLRDRTGREFPVENHCLFCYNVIYNPAPLSLLGMEDSVRKIGPSAIRLQFRNESPGEMSAILKAYGDSFLRGQAADRPAGAYTRGHMKRGVE